jgi:hypothetical protein
MAGLLDYLEGIGETGATLGTGLLSGVVGAPYGIYKGLTSGYYGSPLATRIAQEEAKKFMERNTYVPRGKVAQEALGKAAQLMEQSKLPPILPEAAMLGSIPRQAYLAQVERRGMDLERAMAPRVERMLERGGAGADILQGLAQGTQSRMLSGNNQFDPRFDPRVLEQARLTNLRTTTTPRPNVQEAPQISIVDLEGKPFITSMADRTAAGRNLLGINNVMFNRPVGLLGGQDYMFENPGQVWASAQGPVKQLIENAQLIKQITGEDPLYIPWRMAPTGGDFAHMTGETMLTYADAAMNKGQKSKVNRQIKKMIPGWSGIESPTSIDQFRNAPDKVRKSIKNMMDVNFRDMGGLNIGEARLAVSDPRQFMARDAGIQNVGQIFADKSMIMQSGHPSYPRGVPGMGLGTLKEDLSIFDLLPKVAQDRGIPNPSMPRATDIRALQMKPYAGIIDEELLRRLGY